MTLYSKDKVTVVFENPVYLKTTNGKLFIHYTGKSDYRKLCFLARHRFKIRSKKKRIVEKYIKQLLNRALCRFLEDKGY